MKEHEKNFLFEHVPVATAVCDATGNIKEANQAFRDWFNIQQPTQEPLSFKNYIRPQDRRQFHRFLQKLLIGGEPATCTVTLIEPVSIPLRIEGRRIPTKDSDSPPLMILSLLSNDKEKRLEETLQSYRSALRELRSILALLQTEVDSSEELLNLTLQEALSLTRSQRGCLYEYDEKHATLSIRHIACINEESDPCPSPSREALRHILETRLPYRPRKGILYVPVVLENRVQGLLILHEGSTPTPRKDIARLTLLMNSAWRILEKRRLELLKDTYYKAIQNMQQPVVITDRTGTIQEVNPAFLTMYEYSPEEVVGKNPRILNPGIEVYKNLGFSEEYYHSLFKGMWKDILDPHKGQWEGILINRKKSGTLLWAQTYITSIRDAHGNIQRFIGLPVNISSLKEEESKSKIELYRTIARLSELRDNETGNHMRRVGIYARLLAKTLGMPDKFCEEMELFAPMHDIGKVGISDTILLVNRPLTQEEYEEIKKHTLLGYTIVRDKEELKTAAEIILYHHERWDGKGYPYGLAEEAIPLSARITAIADVYDALRSKRPYKEEWTHEKSVQEIVKNSGLAFDPRVVQVFLQLAKQFAEVYTRLKD